MQTKIAAHFVFRTHVRARSWIISNENYGKTWRHALCFQFRNITAEISVNFFRDNAAVDKFWHTCVFVIPTEVEESRCKTKSWIHGILRLRFASLRMTKTQRISTSDIIASCTRQRSASNSAGVLVGLT